MLEFARLVCALERFPRASFLHDHEGRRVLSAQVDVLDDMPVIYYAPLGEEEGGAGGGYLSYAVRGGREEARIVESAGDASSTYSPIVRVRSLPASLRPGGGGPGSLYHPVALEDMASLARLSYAFEESPFPLFAYPRGEEWLVGMFMTLSEDGASYFCHARAGGGGGGGGGPSAPFLRFSASSGAGPSFVGAPDEHGYNYAKVIRLRGAHPLVDDAQL